jgi:tRNA (adenine22-N1)-methyltransferase
MTRQANGLSLLLHLGATSALVLPPRLQVVHDAVPHGAVVADIGCDHAKLSTALAASGVSPCVYACDASEGAMHKASHTVRDANVGDAVVLRCGDGMAALRADDGVDTIAMAGLGVHRMVTILVGLRDTEHDGVAAAVQTLVLQPMAPRLALLALLRAVLHRRGFAICTESFCTSVDRRGVVRPYLTLTAVRAARPPTTAAERLLGATPPVHDLDYRAYLHHQRAWLADELSGRLRKCDADVQHAARVRRHTAWIRIVDAALERAPVGRASSEHACEDGVGERVLIC